MSNTELDNLKREAESMGVEFHPSIGLEKLQAKINDHLKATASGTKPDASPKAEAKGPTREEQIKAASRLVRVNISCMNPTKGEWDGEIITAGNAVVGTFRKFVKFNTDEGYHIPHIIFEQLKDRKFQTFYNERTKNGVTKRASRRVPEFNIQELPALTQAELDELAKSQAARG
ncbi:hypothetical protein IT774_07685 [Salinimonas marina]|uniref:Uncharacterized protein n=1 Tax=Salinimonas marina TaxID=2785918 RepID=A0A7S9HES7_9ALTE|nr:hypothetical protein [Salinimonas marina]QPG06976.1 hypothetical protein IT774_07685 [Salinimonas marina]